MKRISVLFAMLFVCFATTAMAQRNWSPQDMAKMKEKRKTTLVDSLGVSSAVADSVLAIEDNSRTKMMDLRKSGANRDDLRGQFQTIQDEKNANVKKILSDDAYNKYIGMQQGRMGGGMGGGRRQRNN